LISAVLLQLFNYLIRDAETSSIIICDEVIITFCFNKLKDPLVRVIKYRDVEQDNGYIKKNHKKFRIISEPRLIKLSSLALCGYANIIDDLTCETFRQKLKGMQNLDNVLSSIRDLCQGEDREHHKSKLMNEILSPFLQFLQIITTSELTKDFIDSNRVYESIVEILNDRIQLPNKSLLINIIFNLHLKIAV
jgi:hypothetical protein